MKNTEHLFVDLTPSEMEELKGGYTPLPDDINIPHIKIPPIDICVTGICLDDLWFRKEDLIRTDLRRIV